MLGIIKNNNVEITKGLILLSSLVLFVPALHFLVYALILVSIDSSEWKFEGITKRKLPYLFLGLYIIWTFISLLYSSNIRTGLHYIEKGAPLLFVSVIGVFSTPKQRLSFQLIGESYFFSSSIFVLLCLGGILLSFYNGQLLGYINVYGLNNIDLFAPFLHRTYASALLSMALVPLYISLTTRKEKSLIVFFAAILLFSIYWSGARVALLSAVLLFVLFFADYFYHRVKRSVFVISILAFLVLSAAILFSSPRVKRSYWNLKQGMELSRTFDRYVSWKTALSISNENLLIGVGVGDAEDFLIKKYQKDGYDLWANRELNVHNQYLQTLLETGLVGLVLLLAFLISLVFSFDKRIRIYAISLLLVYGVNFLFESMLLRIIGVFPLAFWFLVLHLGGSEEESDSLRVLKYSKLLTIIIGFVSLIVVSILLVHRGIDAGLPRTYMTVGYTSIDYRSLPQYNDLPEITDAAKLDGSNIKLRPDKVGEFMSFDVYNLNKNVDHKLYYSCWCYVSEDSNLEMVRSYLYNKDIMAKTSSYDLTRKGTWQLLEIEVESAPKYTGMGLRLDVIEEEKIEGYVLYALPTVKF